MRDTDLENKMHSDGQKQKKIAFDVYTNIHPKNYKTMYVFYTHNTQNMIHTSTNSFTLFLSKAVIYIISNLTLLKIMWLF